MSDSNNTTARNTTWFGRPIESLSREELLLCIDGMARLIAVQRENHEGAMRTWEAFRKARRRA